MSGAARRTRRRAGVAGRSGILVISFALAVFAGACSRNGDSAASPSTTGGTASTSTTRPKTSGTEVNGDARITGFDVPERVACAAGVTVTKVKVDYVTEGTARIELVVDGRQEPAVPVPRGPVDATVHCDGLAHTVVLYAYDAQERRTSDRRFVVTDEADAGTTKPPS